LMDAAESSDHELYENFDASLSEEDRWAGVAFARTQGYAARPVEGEEAVARELVSEGIVIGTVINGTEGGTLPEDMSVTLHIMDGDTEQTIEAPLNDSGGFSFEDVPVHQNRSYIVSAFYEGRYFGSEQVQGGPMFGSIEMPVTVYEVTEDPSALYVDGMAFQIQPDPDGNGLQVMQLVNVVNTGDRVFAAQDTLPDGARYPSLEMPLPQGAELLQFAESATRYAMSDDGRTVYDTRPVMPGGDHVMHMTYRLPYEDAYELNQTLDYPIEGFVEAYLPAGMSLTSDQLGNTETEIQQAHRAFDIYAGDLSLAPSNTIAFRLSGQPVPSAVEDQTVTTANVPVIALGAAGILLMISAVVWFVIVIRDEKQPLVQQIARLDERFEAGEIDEATYRKRREALKAKLTAKMQHNQPAS